MIEQAAEERGQTSRETVFDADISNTDGVYDTSANAVLIDCNLGVVAVGKNIAKAFGTLRTFRDLFAFIIPEDSFRLEQFIVRRAPYSILPALEITVCNAPRYRCAVVSRNVMFGKETVVIEFYEDRRAHLMTDRLSLKYMSSRNDPDELDEIMDEAERLLSVFSESHPDETAALRSVVTSALRRCLAPVLIESIIAPVKNRRSAIDAEDILLSASKFIENSFPDASVSTAFYSDAGRRGTVVPGISAEHMWHLVTCALVTALSISEEKRAAFALNQSKTKLKATFCANVGNTLGELPPKLKLGELREILPPSAMRLFLCELICEEYKIASDASFCGGRIEISFEFDLQSDDRGFHRGEKTDRIARLRPFIARVLILADEPDGNL